MRYINHALRSASAGRGSLGASKLYGINGGEHIRESEPSRADSFSQGSAPGAVNLIRKTAGTVTKRRGFTKKSVPFGITGSINAVCDSVYLAENRLYCEKGSHTLPFDTEGMRGQRAGECIFFIGNGALIIYIPKDNRIYYWSAQGCASTGAYTPTIYIGNTPDGAGASYEGVNLLSPYVCELYQGDGQSKVFTTHLEIDGEAGIYVKDESGVYNPVTCESIGGNTVGFKTAPPKPDIAGEDNVKIVYRYKNAQDGFKKLYNCTCMQVFGVNGNRDRVFLSGNGECAGRVYYSHLDNPLYFCDIDYVKVGEGNTNVCSLAYYGTHLAVITDGGVYTLQGADGQSDAIKQDALFLIDGMFASPKPIASEPSQIFGGEPVYLTTEGVYAVSASGILDERCASLRSSRINVFLKNENLKDCRMLTWDDYLVISNGNDRLYLLDGKQFSATDSQPYASKQYEGYVWTEICAKVLWTENGVLFFSDGQGIFAFDGGYGDEREAGVLYPIDAYWETPYLYGADISDYKFFDKLSVLCDSDSGADTNIKVFARFDNAPWRIIKKYDAKMRVFNYGGFDYSLFTYSDYVYNYVVATRLLHKKGRGIKLRFQNDRLGEPFTIIRFTIEYMTM